MKKSEWKVAFLGDDFTGSTDVMEVLTLFGMPTLLFLEPPKPEELAKLRERYECIGIAGITRSMATDELRNQLRASFSALNALNATLVHYKICSTFDSSPERGSIGAAIEEGIRIFESDEVLLIVGVPQLNRFVAFGNLFARVGEIVHRLDRHPTMRNHPITPMDESDILEHLQRQTPLRSELINLIDLAATDDELERRFLSASHNAEVILFDTVDESHLTRIGRFLWEGERPTPRFVVGSSGVEYALGQYLESQGLIARRQFSKEAHPCEALLVMCGSASPVTEKQIRHALNCGYVGHQLELEPLLNPASQSQEIEKLSTEFASILKAGKSLIVYATLGPRDPAIQRRNEMALRLGLESLGSEIARIQSILLHQTLLKQPSVRRVCVAGGDTSGYCAKALGIRALEMVTPIAPGAPLCRVLSDTRFDGMEIALKGGQNGEQDYFECIRRGCRF